jgi:hypothetical protein
MVEREEPGETPPIGAESAQEVAEAVAVAMGLRAEHYG